MRPKWAQIGSEESRDPSGFTSMAMENKERMTTDRKPTMNESMYVLLKIVMFQQSSFVSFHGGQSL